MRRSRQRIVIFMIFVLLLQVIPVYKVRAEEVIFGDAAVEKAIRSQLSYTGPITEDIVGNLTYLSITTGEIKSLKGLEYAVNMKYLMLNNNQITDLSPLTNMKNLYALELQDNQISDLAPLASLTGLNYVNISNNQISDISALSGLTKLEYLSLSGNKISDLSPLAAARALKELYVGNNKITSIEPVRSLTSLEKFVFSKNQVTLLSPLGDLTQLKEVIAVDNCIDLKNKANQSVVSFLKQNKVAVNTDNQIVSEQEEAAGEDVSLKWNILYDDSITDGDCHADTDTYAYGNGIYVERGGYISKNGVNWRKNPEFKDVKLVDVAWGKNMFVGLGYEGKTWTSKDGIHWVLNKQEFDANGSMKELAFNGKLFVAVGGNYYGGKIFTSQDGITWTKSNIVITDIKGVAWGKGTFVALGYEGAVVAVSKDGKQWKKLKLPIEGYRSLWNIIYANGIFIVVGDYTLLTSKDGANWKTFSSDGLFWSDIYWVKDRFYLKGFKYADDRVTPITVSRTSKDGNVWTDIKSNSNGFAVVSLSYDGKKFISYPSKGTFTSTDGVNWKLTKINYQKPEELQRSATGNGKLVAVGGTLDRIDPEAENLDKRCTLQISSDGTYKFATEKGKYPLYDIIWTGKSFFAVGYKGVMMSSADGLKWSKIKSPANETLNRIINVKGSYYVTGDNGLILSSKDLKTWTKQKTNVKNNIYSIAWNGKTFVAVGEGALMLVSDNGTTWSKVKRSDTNNYSDIIWAKGTFVVTTSDTDYVTETSMIYKSTDGKEWTQTGLKDNWSREGVGEGFYGIVYTGDMFAALGCGGTISLSEDAVNWSIQDVSVQMIMQSAQVINGKMYAFGERSIVYVADMKN